MRRKMKQTHLLFQTVVLILYVLRITAQIPDTGRIYIGSRFSNQTTQYHFSLNINGSESLPVYARVTGGINGSEVAVRDNIIVNCESNIRGEIGYSSVNFNQILTLTPATTQGSIPVSILGSGRPVLVTCYGQSVGTNCSAQIAGNVTAPQPQFCNGTSRSESVSVTVYPAPVVSFCQSIVTVSSRSSTVSLALSETVVSADVNIHCNTTACDGTGTSMALNISNQPVAIGSKTVNLLYNVMSDGNCTRVRCFAQSSGGSQFMSSTSSDESSVALFIASKATVNMKPQIFNVYNTSFQSMLYFDADKNEEVNFQCQAQVAASLDFATQLLRNPDCTFTVSGLSTIPTTTTSTTTTTTTTTTAPPTLLTVNGTTLPRTTAPPLTTPTPTKDPTSPWVVIDNSFTVQSMDLFYMVRTARQLLVIAPVQEIVVTTCCSLSTGRYRNQSIATVAVAELQPVASRNNTGGVTSGQPGDERFVINPAYREVAPCPCDLIFGTCDINCCCDGECSSAEIQSFRACIAGRPGGQDPGPNQRSCKSTHYPKDDWFPVMCVEFESNGLLGHFYSNTPKLTSLSAINSKVAEQTDLYTYRDTESRFSDLAVSTGYKDGSNILTLFGEGTTVTIGSLSFPQRSSSGQCVDTAPVRFLRNSQSTCTRMLTRNTCVDLTPFSARTYLQSSTLFNPACPHSFAVSTSGQNSQEKATVSVNYYCQVNDSFYRASNKAFSDLVNSRTAYSVADINCTDLCNDALCNSTNKGLDESTSTTLPPRCSFDNGFVLPPSPLYNATTQGCENTVLEVRYLIHWSGQNITSITADIVIGNIISIDTGIPITQVFKVTFDNSFSGSSNQSDNFQNLTAIYDRSGRPGYDFGKPLANGCKQTNATTGTFININVNTEKQMAVWSPGPDGLCLTSKRRFLTFGDNLMSSCVLRLTVADINNCSALRQRLLNHLNVLMPANVIGRLGYNDPQSEIMWVNVLREDLNFTQTTTTSPTTISSTTSVTINSTITTTDNLPNSEIISPLETRTGICQNVPSGIHLEIMYAETGRNNRYPLREVIGAAIRYTQSTWEMFCTGANAVRCQRNDPQTFLLRSSVQFTKVSPTSPQQPILFYTIHKKDTCDSDTCYRFFEDFDNSTCHYDTCWGELFYPLTAAYQGYEGLSYTRAFSLVMLLFFIGYFFVTYLWK